MAGSKNDAKAPQHPDVVEPKTVSVKACGQQIKVKLPTLPTWSFVVAAR